ncbi:MAG: hypothetical protein HW405_942 [Candidatus Berkelbacteria bacterium]|nr:hypothetical protein [Candidatus Berkelbacteria bacterium]
MKVIVMGRGIKDGQWIEDIKRDIERALGKIGVRSGDYAFETSSYITAGMQDPYFAVELDPDDDLEKAWTVAKALHSLKRGGGVRLYLNKNHAHRPLGELHWGAEAPEDVPEKWAK